MGLIASPLHPWLGIDQIPIMEILQRLYISLIVLLFSITVWLKSWIVTRLFARSSMELVLFAMPGNIAFEDPA